MGDVVAMAAAANDRLEKGSSVIGAMNRFGIFANTTYLHHHRRRCCTWWSAWLVFLRILRYGYAALGCLANKSKVNTCTTLKRMSLYRPRKLTSHLQLHQSPANIYTTYTTRALRTIEVYNKNENRTNKQKKKKSFKTDSIKQMKRPLLASHSTIPTNRHHTEHEQDVTATGIAS